MCVCIKWSTYDIKIFLIYLFVNNILYIVSTPCRIFVDNTHSWLSSFYRFDVHTVKIVHFTYFTYDK